MTTRLKMLEKVSTLHEKIGREYLVLEPGTVFDHPDDARAKVLLSIDPPICVKTTEKTAKEKAAIEQKARDIAEKQLSEAADKNKSKAEKALAEEQKEKQEARNKALELLEKELNKAKLEDVQAEAESLGIDTDGVKKADLIEAILKTEREKPLE